MSKKIVLLSAVLAIVGAGFMFFAHRNAEAKVCFVTDGDCGSEIEASTPNVEACANLNYNCSSGTTSCNYKNNSNFVEWINNHGGNANSDGAWNTLKCPLNQDYWMYCPKGFRLACGANYTSTLTCGQYKNCECKSEFKYDGSYYNGHNGPKTGEGVDPCAQKCHGRGDPCLEVSVDGTFDTSNLKYPACICEHPYVVTKSQCEEAGAQVADMNDFCQPSSAITDNNNNQCNAEGAPEKYYRGCFCPPEYQYTVASCDGEVGGLKCTNESGVDLWTSCFNCEDLGFHASLVEVDSHVRHTQAALGADPAVSPCIANDETCMSNFTSSTVNNHPVYNKSNTYQHAYAEPSNQWPQVLWNDLAKYSYLQCPLQSNHGLYDNYYIVDCAEPGMRPSTSNDLRPDGVTYYHDGEACVPDSCVNVVKTILRTDEGIAKRFALFYPEGVDMPDDVPGTILPDGKYAYLIDGNGHPVVERYVNSEGGGYLKTGFDCPAGTMCAWSESWDSDNNMWTAPAGHPDTYNYTDIKGPSDQTDYLPARRIAIVLDSTEYGLATDYIEVNPSENYEQNLNYCTRQVCSPDGTEAGPFYRVQTGCADGSSGSQGGDLCANHGGYKIKTGTSACSSENCGDQSGCTGENTSWLRTLDTLQRFVSYDILEAIIPSAHAATWVGSHAMICYEHTGWSKKPFWKFAGDSDVIKGNYGKNENHWTKIGDISVSWPAGQGVCGGVTYQGDQCVTCHRKHVVKSCLNHSPVSAGQYNNCLATASTAPEITTAMQLQSQNSGFCFETDAGSKQMVKTYRGLKGAPADEYISIKEFYRVIQNYPTHGGGYLLSSQKKSTYLSMLERSCKVGDNDPNPKIKYNSDSNRTFPAVDKYNSEYESEPNNDAILTFDGIDLDFHGDTLIARQFNFTNGTITADGELYFKYDEDSFVANSVMNLNGSEDKTHGLPTNLVDTDVHFCGTLAVSGEPGEQSYISSSDGSHSIQKLNSCSSATFFVRNNDVTSYHYKYVVDKFNIAYTANVNGRSSIYRNPCNKIAFIGEKSPSNPDIVANSMVFSGGVLFDSMYMTSSNVAVAGDYATSNAGGDCSKVHSTFVNMKNSTLRVPKVNTTNYFFKMGPASAIGKLATGNTLDITQAPNDVDLDILGNSYTGLLYKAKMPRGALSCPNSYVVGYGTTVNVVKPPLGDPGEIIQPILVSQPEDEIMCKSYSSNGLRSGIGTCVTYQDSSSNYVCDASGCVKGTTSNDAACSLRQCVLTSCY